MKIENPNPIQWRFAERAEQLQSSFIREILKITQRPEIISFAGGLPSPATFPVEEMKTAFDKVLSNNGKVALQYGPPTATCRCASGSPTRSRSMAAPSCRNRY